MILFLIIMFNGMVINDKICWLVELMIGKLIIISEYFVFLLYLICVFFLEFNGFWIKFLGIL